jgi:hypothetical protein
MSPTGRFASRQTCRVAMLVSPRKMIAWLA